MSTENDNRIKAFLEELSPAAKDYFFPSEEEKAALNKFLPPIHKESSSFNTDIHFRITIGDMMMEKQSDVYAKTFDDAVLTKAKRLPERDEMDAATEAKLRKMLAEVEKLQKKYGITIEELIASLKINVKLSHLEIDELGTITLVDFDYKEVPMSPLTKTVFLLFLNHPEGIYLKSMPDYRAEMENIYLSISGRSDMDSIRKSLDDLADPLSNSMNEKISHVRRAFLNVVNDNVAGFYYIQGERGTAKKIILDRSYVTNLALLP